jgi:hypothetical protein
MRGINAAATWFDQRPNFFKFSTSNNAFAAGSVFPNAANELKLVFVATLEIHF